MQNSGYQEKIKATSTTPSEAASFLSKALKHIQNEKKKGNDEKEDPTLIPSLSSASLAITEMRHSRMGSRQKS